MNDTIRESSVYTDAVAAGLEVGNHESDLYLPNCKEAHDILKRHGYVPLGTKDAHPKLTYTSFWDQVANKLALEVPFAYDPWWAARQQP